MDSISTLHRSPSFNTIPSHNITNEDEHEFEFEFPIMCRDSISRQISFNESNQFSKQYPLFDQSLLLNDDVNVHVDVNLCTNAVNDSITECQPSLTTRSSLMKLFDEDRETSSSDDLDGVTPGTYCVWKPKTDPDPNPNPDPNSKRRGKQAKHKKSNSVSIGNTSNRWNVRDLLKRSYSDDGYCDGKESPVLLFIPPISPENVKVKKIPAYNNKSKIPAYNNNNNNNYNNNNNNNNINNKLKVGNVCYSPYLPYKKDQLAAYANFNGGKQNIYRY